VTAVPSLLAPMLRTGALDLALVSAVELFRDPPLGWIPGPAITSCGPVRSINLYLRRPLNAVRRVALDTSSLSASALTQVCLDRFLGCSNCEIVPGPPDLPLASIDADAVLRIGDPALTTSRNGHEVLDLGAVWSEHTGLPFVYALWLANPDLLVDDRLDLLIEARDRGLTTRDALADRFATAQHLSAELCRSYLESSIGYHLGEAERAGLELFGRLAYGLDLVDRDTLRPPLR